MEIAIDTADDHRSGSPTWWGDVLGVEREAARARLLLPRARARLPVRGARLRAGARAEDRQEPDPPRRHDLRRPAAPRRRRHAAAEPRTTRSPGTSWPTPTATSSARSSSRPRARRQAHDAAPPPRHPHRRPGRRPRRAPGASRSTTRSPRRSSSSPPRASSGGSPSGCRTGSAPGPRGSDGVCAGVRFLNPRSLVALLTGTEHDDPWDPDRFVWPLLERHRRLARRALVRHSWPATSATGTAAEQGELRRNRRYSVARRLAGLFASYAVQRPRLLTDWREGRDTDGAGEPLPSDLAWQPELWRRLLAEYDDGRAVGPPDERHRQALAAVRGGAPLALPSRLSMFGHTRMPVTELELLRAVGEVREVHLWLPAALARGLAAGLPRRRRAGPVRRRDDRSGRLLVHPLLASLGRDSRELQRSLALLGPLLDDELATPSEPVTTLLARLQATSSAATRSTVGARRRPTRSRPGARVPRPRPSGRGAPRGPRRAARGRPDPRAPRHPRDVPRRRGLRAALLRGLRARGGGGGSGHGGHGGTAAPRAPAPGAARRPRARRAPTRCSPSPAPWSGSRGAAPPRARCSTWPAARPVRHRFGLDDDDLAELDRLGRALRGPVGAHRRPAGAVRPRGVRGEHLAGGARPGAPGAAVAEDGTVLGRRLPLDDVGSSAIDLAGRLAELVDRLEERSRSRCGRRPRWPSGSAPCAARRPGTRGRRRRATLAWPRSSSASWTSGPRRGSRRRAAVRPRGSPTSARCSSCGSSPVPTRANFRTGHLTVATLVPMRSVPHRVVCLVGLDDGVFPRTTIPDGDDVLARDPMTGERDARSEDRQLLLDAVLAARETLVVTYTGANVPATRNARRRSRSPSSSTPSSGWQPGARDRVVRRHPLQPFDPRNFAGRRR